MTKEITRAMTELLQGKEVVVDTSSLLLAGTNLISALPACHLVIPSIVIKELEEKRSHGTVGFLAREWLRLLEDLRVEHQQKLSSGVPCPKYSHVLIRIEPNHSNQGALPKHLQDNSHDSTVLAVAKNLISDGCERDVVLLSNDAPMRLHATLDLKLEAIEFSSALLQDAQPFNGVYEVTIPDDEFVNSDAVDVEGGEPIEDVIASKLPEDAAANALVQVKVEGSSRTYASLIWSGGRLSEVKRRQKSFGVVPRTLEQDVAVNYLRRPADELPIVSLGGGAGTGKTLLSVAVGLEALEQKEYQKMVVFRSLHEMGRGQELGFLPGDLKEKMEAWAGAIYDALDYIAGIKGTPSKVLCEHIEVSPITYLRGRSLSNSYIILEEAQNFSRNEILHILSRAGEGTKLVLTSDANQVDNKFLQAGNKADIWSVVDSLRNEDIFAHVTLTKTERSRVAAITSRLLAN